MYSKISCFELCSLKLESPQTGVARMLILQKRDIVEYEQCSYESTGLACCEDPEVTVTVRLFEHYIFTVALQNIS